ncbi:hypothetical protein SEPCBS57363_000937 [Sporothrix epigloea]|uniref:Meiosis-specific APC/C activator protein AMA1 n=1 Tax=Sporothrix epigloea TaxID=1892477 RepID=A0ABP0D7J0_9PEZI
MDIPNAFMTSLPTLPIRAKTPDNETAPSLQDLPPITPGFSSLDSGYGSAEPTPTKISVYLDEPFDYCCSYTLDGSFADSDDYRINDITNECPRSALLSPEQKLLSLAANTIKQRSTKLQKASKNASVRQSNKARVGLPSCFYTTCSPKLSRRRRSDSLSSSLLSTSLSSTSIRAPDRFVHPRDSDCAAFDLGERFHLTKAAQDLTAVEKLLRNDRISSDVFFNSAASTIPVPTFADARQEIRHRHQWLPQTRTRTTLMPGQEDDDPESEFHQRLIQGPVWSVGTVPPIVGAIDNGRGSLVQTGTTAPFFTSTFVKNLLQPSTDIEMHCGRIAAALDFDRASRLLQCNIDRGVFKLQYENIFSVPVPGANKRQQLQSKIAKSKWNGAVWVKEKKDGKMKQIEAKKADEYRPLRYVDIDRPLSSTYGLQNISNIILCSILSAPNYRDDFYCSLLAYCPTTGTVAVGLADLLYTWSESEGAAHLNGGNNSQIWLTCLAFSSEEGGRGILAFGRSNNVFGLMAVEEANNARMLIEESSSISCLSWRPTCTMRPSKNPNKPGILVSTEDLLVGTDSGLVLYYVIEWPEKSQVDEDNWQGDITLVARISVHNQQICGISWAPDGESFATGGNDNNCCFFYTNNVLPPTYHLRGNGEFSDSQSSRAVSSDLANSSLVMKQSNGSEVRERVKNRHYVRQLNRGTETWRWEHGAAVKAIDFCPWQDGLVATGGGSSDRCIRFFHSTSGTPLATIFVSAQVTSLVWSTTRREIAATFGFTHPIHPVRIAVYSWPDCKQVAAIPWEGKHRALYGISCSQSGRRHGRKPKSKERPATHKLKDGCIAVASSEANIKFYELWPSDDKPILTGVGMLGGSDILEDLEGIQKDGDIIR